MAKAAERDVYANLLRDTRELRRDQASARDVWYATLPWDRKEETLFELEMLLKGVACFGNPRNHPGQTGTKTAVAQDFQAQLRVVRDVSYRVVQLTRSLLGDKEQEYRFSRYLETVLPEDAARGKLIQEQLSQETPEDALLVLRNSFGHFLDLADGILRLGRTSHRLYAAFHGVVVREVGRNAFFNPLVQLEFRPEFDRIKHAEVLDVLHGVRTESAHRVLALVFLTLFRCLRYAQMLEQYGPEPIAVRRCYVVLAVLRSDIRALTRFLSRGAAISIADGLERDMLAVPASEIKERYGELSAEARALISLRGMLESIASGLRIEVRRVFERDVPAPEVPTTDKELGAQMVLSSATLRAALEHALRVLCAELRPDASLPSLGDDASARRMASERLRRDIWIFQQVLRAFLALAEQGPRGSDTWAGAGGLQFVRDFLQHFRAIGYQLVRAHDYPRLNAYLESLEELRDVDLLEPSRLLRVAEESKSFARFLGELFERVGNRAELRGVAFDRQTAGEVLKIYLGRA
jgi:hypothetical protein